MIRILILDDDVLKVNQICEVLYLNPDLIKEKVETCNHLVQARKLLETERFDLLILDLKLPNRVGEVPKEDAGKAFLDEIQQSDRLRKPFHIVGLTSYDTLYDQNVIEFHGRLWHLLHASPSDNEWRNRLRIIVEYLIESKKSLRNEIASYSYDLAIVTALPKTELKNVLSLGTFTEETFGDDSTVYYKALFRRDQKADLKVVTAVAPQMGMQAASVLTVKLIEHFRPRYVAVTGIAAGIGDGGNFGDIIIADQSFDYGSGKIISTNNAKPVFKPDPKQIPLDNVLKERFIALQVADAYVNEIAKSWPGAAPTTKLNIQVGGLASGAAVVQDLSLVNMVLSANRKVLGIDMETYGVFYATHNCCGPRPKVFSIKSISDFADQDKVDTFQPYAAYTSSRYLYHFAVNNL